MQVYQDAELKVYRGGVVQPVEMDLVSAGTRSIMFNARLPTTTLGPGQRGEAVVSPCLHQAYHRPFAPQLDL